MFMRKLIFITLILLAKTIIVFGQTDTTTVAATEEFIPIITLSVTDFEGDEEVHDISGLLQGSRDVFM